MSRIGNAPIILPEKVTVEILGQEIKVGGPLGNLTLTCHPDIKVKQDNNQIVVEKLKETNFARSLHGLTRSLLFNMVVGVKSGWEKKLELVGVGYRASLNGNKLTLNVGYSHPIEIVASEGIKFNVEDNTKITVSGIDKIVVGQTAATIRQVRPPEPYQGKGIRLSGEYVRRKAGKAGKVGAGAK